MPQSQVAWLAQHVEWWNEGDHEDVTSVPVQTLDLSNRQLTHTSLQLLPDALTCLDLSRCGLEHAAALQRLPRLELLNVSYNRLTSIDDIRASKGLKVLYARSNRISSVEGLAAVRGLQSLDLECNALSSIEALAPLWRLQHLVELRLRGNLLPNYQRMCEEKLPALTSLDGVRLVECDEREASVPSFPPMPSKATSTTSLGAPPPPHALSVPRRDGAEPLTHGRPSSPPGSSVGSPERLQQLRAAHPFGLPAGDPMASCKSPSAGLATDSAVPAAHDPPPSARRHTERDDAAAFHRGARQAASPSHRALREAPAEPSSPPHRTAPPRGGGASCARAAAARSPPPATSPAEAEALRSEVVRLEKALQQAQAIRHRDVAQCARSAAHQVQELSAAIVKADRMLAESAVETERMANDMADGEQRYEAELNRMRAELSRVQAERDEAEAALHRAQLGAASFADATCPAASGGSSAPASSSVGTPVPCVHCSLATAVDSGGSRRAETPDEPRGWAAVREATERELFAKSAMIERLKAQVRALMGEQQLLSRQLTDQVATLRGLSPQISTALKTRSTGKPLHSSANLDQATRAKVMMIVADVVDSELVRLEEQREQRKRHHQEMVKATSEDAQYALAAAEEEQAARAALADTIRYLSDERGRLEAKLSTSKAELREAALLHSREMQALGAERLAEEQVMRTRVATLQQQLSEALESGAKAMDDLSKEQHRCSDLEARLVDRSELDEFRKELAKQMGVVAKQQGQLEALMAEANQERRNAEQAREREKLVAAAKDSAEKSFNEALLAERELALRFQQEATESAALLQAKRQEYREQLDVANVRQRELEEELEHQEKRAGDLRETLSKAVADADASERKLLEQLEEREATINALMRTAVELQAKQELTQEETRKQQATAQMLAEGLAYEQNQLKDAQEQIEKFAATLAQQLEKGDEFEEQRQAASERASKMEQSMASLMKSLLSSRRDKEQTEGLLANAVADVKASCARRVAQVVAEAAEARAVLEERVRVAEAAVADARAELKQQGSPSKSERATPLPTHETPPRSRYSTRPALTPGDTEESMAMPPQGSSRKASYGSDSADTSRLAANVMAAGATAQVSSAIADALAAAESARVDAVARAEEAEAAWERERERADEAMAALKAVDRARSIESLHAGSGALHPEDSALLMQQVEARASTADEFVERVTSWQATADEQAFTSRNSIATVEIAQLRADLQELKEENTALSERLRSRPLSSPSKGNEIQPSSDARSSEDSHPEVLYNLKVRIDELEERLAMREEEVARLLKEKVGIEEEKAEIEGRLAARSVDMKARKADMELLQEEKGALQEEVGKLEERLTAREAELRSRKTGQARLEEENGELKERLTARETENQRLQREKGALQERLSVQHVDPEQVQQLQKELRELSDENAALQDRLAVFASSVETSRQETASTEMTLKQREAEITRLKASLRETEELKQTAAKHEETAAKLEAARAELQAARGEQVRLQEELDAQLMRDGRRKGLPSDAEMPARLQVSRRVRDLEERLAAAELESEISESVLARELANVERSLSRLHAVTNGAHSASSGRSRAHFTDSHEEGAPKLDIPAIGPRAFERWHRPEPERGEHRAWTERRSTNELEVTVEGVIRRIRYVESQLEDANRRATDACSRAQASEHRARNCEAALESLKAQFAQLDYKRGQLAMSLDTSLRQLGSAHNALREKEDALSRMRHRAPHTDEHPGLLHDLALLQLKLHGNAGPLLTCHGSNLPPMYPPR